PCDPRGAFFISWESNFLWNEYRRPASAALPTICPLEQSELPVRALLFLLFYLNYNIVLIPCQPVFGNFLIFSDNFEYVGRFLPSHFLPVGEIQVRVLQCGLRRPAVCQRFLPRQYPKLHTSVSQLFPRCQIFPLELS